MALASNVKYASEYYVYRPTDFMFTLFHNGANLHNKAFIFFMLWETKLTPRSQKKTVRCI